MSPTNFKLKHDKSKARLFLLLLVKQASKKALLPSPCCLKVPVTTAKPFHFRKCLKKNKPNVVLNLRQTSSAFPNYLSFQYHIQQVRIWKGFSELQELEALFSEVPSAWSCHQLLLKA